MGRKGILTEKQIEWAYKMWCLGYTQSEIAKALFVHKSTIQTKLCGRKRIKPTLVYDFNDEEK
jgi:transcriptional regulator